MRIAYGVMGYGRGHAMRTAAVLPALMENHEVTVFAGGDAYEALHARFPVVRIPTIGYVYGSDGRHSDWLTFTRNYGLMSDLLLGGYGSELVADEFRQRRINLVISDSEAWTHRAAQKLAIPRISFDHVGIMAYCRPEFALRDRLRGPRDGLAYLYLMGQPERALVSSFYPAPPRRATTALVGPILRDTVLQARAERGDFLLAYFNKGEHQFLPHIEAALRALRMPVVVYGTPRRGEDGKLHFKAPSQDGFVRDLAGCRAVLCTAGNQLLSEALYLVKPVLAIPEDVVEQRMNALAVGRLRIGMQADLYRLTTAKILEFLEHIEYYRDNMRRHRRDGRGEAIATLERYIGELSHERRPPRARRAAGLAQMQRLALEPLRGRLPLLREPSGLRPLRAAPAAVPSSR